MNQPKFIELRDSDVLIYVSSFLLTFNFKVVDIYIYITYVRFG